jgi:hypothetical protein
MDEMIYNIDGKIVFGSNVIAEYIKEEEAPEVPLQEITIEAKNLNGNIIAGQFSLGMTI